jgi:L-ascorbate metabolism protein UlaG (beta-lactamase superfamily)
VSVDNAGVSTPISEGMNRRNFLGRSGLALAAGASLLATSQNSAADDAKTVASGTTDPSASPAGTPPSGEANQVFNNRHVLKLQDSNGKPSEEGVVTIDYFGHCALRLTSPKGLTLLFDPWRNDPTGAWGLWFPKEFPKTTVDIGLSTHTHFDHNALDRVESTIILDRLVGTWTFADVQITGVADKHATATPGWYKWINVVREFGQDPYPPNNPSHLDMVSFVVETGGIRTLIWGDNRHNPPESVWRLWGQIDVLTLPVDGSQHILSYEQGDAIVARLKPKIVIPTHYLAEGTSSTLSTLQTADEWVANQKNKQTVEASTLKIEPGKIASLDRHFFYFGNQVVRV